MTYKSDILQAAVGSRSGVDTGYPRNKPPNGLAALKIFVSARD